MPEDPQQPGDGAPEDAAPAGPDTGGEAPESGGDAPGPEIEGVEELVGAVQPEPAEGDQPGPGADEGGPGGPGAAPEVEGAAPGAPAAEEGARAPGEEDAPPAGEGAGREAADTEAREPADGEEAPSEAADADLTVPAAEAEEAAAPRAPRPRPRRRRRQEHAPAEEAIPGAHLEPDLVLEEQPAEAEGEYAQYGEYVEAETEAPGEAAVLAELEEVPEEAPAEPAPVPRQPLDLAADARYHATGKRKSAVARVILRPGEGTYQINGRHLDEYFPRVRLQRMARQPLEAAGYHTRMDVVAHIHGGGVSAQATALRHGVARALVEADPALRAELKRRGYLTRDPRVKERKKAGLKKARKRPQFSKR